MNFRVSGARQKFVGEFPSRVGSLELRFLFALDVVHQNGVVGMRSAGLASRSCCNVPSLASEIVFSADQVCRPDRFGCGRGE